MATMSNVLVSRRIRLDALAVCILCVGCGAYRLPSRPSLPSTLPPLAVDVLAVPSVLRSSVDTAAGQGSRITLSAANADVRELLPALASAAGVSMVIAPDARGRVTVHVVDANAREVLQSVIEQAGLTLGPVQLIAPYPRLVFYDLPVNVNAASAATIQARFGVSAMLAKLVVAARPHQTDCAPCR
ncbi:MAG: hypothetical protein Q7S20_02155 [Gemmatimonadaceae bacterium]|nr:hypothetical protein [Gemmatimonadaceae bacterium]